MKIALGADIGGSHISCAAVNMQNHTIIDDTYSIENINNKGTASEIISGFARALKNTLNKAGIEQPIGIGLAMPGPFDYVNGIGLFKGVEKFDNLNGVNVREELLKEMNFVEDVPVRFMNDATSFAVGAVWSDDSLEDKNVLAITLGTGFGSAFIINSLPALVDERVPEMGCVYHLPYKNGIADDNFSTRGLIAAYREKSGEEVKGVKEIAEAAAESDNARQVMETFGYELADFLNPWINKAGISHMIMGGNISKAYSLFSKNLEEGFVAGGKAVEVSISSETEFLAILGSARLCDENYWIKINPLLKHM